MDAQVLVELLRTLYHRLSSRNIDFLAEVMRAGEAVGLPEAELKDLVFGLVSNSVAEIVPATVAAPVSAPPLTEKQARVLDFIRKHAEEHDGYRPSHREVAGFMGTGAGAAWVMLKTIRRKGLLSEYKPLPRTLKREPSRRQSEILAFFHEYHRNHSRWPSYSTVGQHFRLRVVTVLAQVARLEKKGLMVRPGRGGGPEIRAQPVSPPQKET